MLTFRCEEFGDIGTRSEDCRVFEHWGCGFCLLFGIRGEDSCVFDTPE